MTNLYKPRGKAWKWLKLTFTRKLRRNGEIIVNIVGSSTSVLEWHFKRRTDRASHALVAKYHGKTEKYFGQSSLVISRLLAVGWWVRLTVLSLDTPRGLRTRATARPSGTLCTASVAEMRKPSRAPLVPPKDTPIPTPSEKECNVITKTMSSTFGVPPFTEAVQQVAGARDGSKPRKLLQERLRCRTTSHRWRRLPRTM